MRTLFFTTFKKNKMKRTHILFPLLLILAMVSDSCIKKEPDDPLISFRSRKGRVCGHWTSDEGSIAISNTNYSESYAIRGNTFTYTGPFGYANGTANVVFDFERDGNCNVSINLSGFVSEYAGRWDWSGGIGDQKSKTQIIVHANTYTDGTGAHTLQGNNYDFTYDIIELRNKKMVLKLTYRNDDSSGGFNAYSESWRSEE